MTALINQPRFENNEKFSSVKYSDPNNAYKAAALKKQSAESAASATSSSSFMEPMDAEEGDVDADIGVTAVGKILLQSVLQFSGEEEQQQLKDLCAAIEKFDNKRVINTDLLLDMFYERVDDHMLIEDIIDKHLKGSDPRKQEIMETGDVTDNIVNEPKSMEKTENNEKKKELKPELTCKVCLDKQVAVTFVPCGHLVTCVSCTSALFECPVCRAQIRGTIRTYL